MLFARFESNLFEGLGRVFAALAARAEGGDGLVAPLTSRFVWASKEAKALQT